MARTARALPVQPSSPNALHRATLALRDLREKLIAIDPSIVEDVTLFGDMLDGESNALDVLADMVRAALEAEGWVELMKLRKADLDQRRARYERRSDALRAGVLAVLQDIGLPRLEREDFTASVTGGHRRVIITDDKALPEGLASGPNARPCARTLATS